MSTRRSGMALVAAVVMITAALAAPDIPALQKQADEAAAAGRWSEARPVLESLLTALEGSPARSSAAIADTRWLLGDVAGRLGDHDAAADLLTRALVELERAGAGADKRGACANSLGLAAHAAGRFTAAEQALQKAVSIHTGQGAALHADEARLHLAQLYLTMARMDDAARLLREIHPHGLRPSATLPAGVLAQRWQITARWHQAAGSFREAADCLRQALALTPAETADAAVLQNDLAMSLYRIGSLTEAGRLLKSAVHCFRKSDDTGRATDLAGALNNHGVVLLAQGQPRRAMEEMQAALAAQPDRAAVPEDITRWLTLSAAALQCGEVKIAAQSAARAMTTAEKFLPPVHPQRAQIALNAACTALADGDAEGAQRHARASSDAARRWLTGQASTFGAEARIMAFRRTADAVSPLASFCQDDAPAIADAVLATKDAALDIVLHLRRQLSAAGPETAALWRQAAAEMESISQSRGSDSPAAAAARDRMDALRSSLPGAAPGMKSDWRTTAERLPRGGVFIDYCLYRRWTGTGPVQDCAGAVVLQRDHAPQWIDLGPAAAVERLIELCLIRAAAVAGGAPAGGLNALLQGLESKLWPPALAAAAGTASQLVLRPDGMLHFVPWALLRHQESDGKPWFCQRYPNVIISSFARVAPAARPSNVWRVLGVPGAPAAGAPPPPLTVPPPFTREVWETLRGLPALPGVTGEADAIRQWAVAAGATCDVVSPAREDQLATSPPPAVLHLCCHGFALPDVTPDDLSGHAAIAAAPLHRSGLVLSGCGEALTASGAGKPLPHHRDGTLFAGEAAALPLDGTMLVTLSACRAALGSAHPGDHLTGLRRAFLTAGARSVLSPLWDVSDRSTPEFMRRVYQLVSEGKSPAAAVWQTQGEWLAQRPAAKDVVNAGAWLCENAGW